MALPSSAWSRVPTCRQDDPSTGLESGNWLSGKERCLQLLPCGHSTACNTQGRFRVQAGQQQVCTATCMAFVLHGLRAQQLAWPSWLRPSHAGPSAAVLPLHL